MKYVLAIVALLIAAPYFMAGTGPHSIPCSYDRIGRSVLSIVLFQSRTDEEMARANALDPNCR